MTEDLSTSTQRIVDITFRGTVYRVACREGEESRLNDFMANINEMVNTILGVESSKAKVSDVLLLLLVCFKLLDRVEELESSFQKMTASLRACEARYDTEIELRSALEQVLSYSADRISKLVCILKDRTDGKQLGT